MKRILSLILALVMVIGLLPVTTRAGALDNGLVYEVCEDHVHVHEYTATVTEPTCMMQGYTTYTCVCGDYYVADEVEPLGHDYMDGRCSRCFLFDPGNDSLDPSNGRFAPDAKLTRSMLCYALWNYWGSPAPSSTENPFTDLDESAYYYDAVLWAVENAITRGISATEFGPDTPVNRAQAATFLWRTFGSPYIYDDNPFTDVHDTDFFYQSALWAYAEGYMTPLDTEDTFKPASDCLYGHIYWGPGDHTHEYEVTSITAPTCFSQGYTTHTCTICGRIYLSDHVPALPHEYEATGTTAPTCSSQGFTTYTCDLCGYSYMSDYVPALPHEYEGVITATPTCTKKGCTTYTCTVCGHSYAADDVRPLGHDFVDGICSRCFMHEPNHGEAPSDPGKGMFAPDVVLTRSMFFYALWNYFGSPEPISTENPFTDISESDYYYDAALWAVENGITSGTSATQFGPDRNMARLQAATFLWRAFGSPEAPTENPFTDIKEGDFFYEAVLWACAEGYMNHSYNTSMGYWDITSFDPYGPCLYGHINWVPTNHPHQYTAAVTYPTCTEQGFTTYTCDLCGYSYPANYVEPLGHDYTDGRCSRCFLFDPDNDSFDPSNGRFAPEDVLTRGMFCYALWNFCGSPEPSILNPFTDLKESDDYYKAVLWVVENAITSGISATEFGLDMPVNRAQAATFLWRSFGSPDVSVDNPFTDVPDHTFFHDSALWVYAEGYMAPLYAEDTFKPTDICLYGHINWGPGDHTHEYTAVITAPTCTRKGFTTYTCTVCGHSYVSDYVDTLPHEYDAVITDPTCTKKGYTTYTCTVCGHSYAADDVNPLGHDFVDGFCSRCFLYDPNYGEAPSDPGKGMFAPDEALTRSMFFYALWNYFGSPEPIHNVNPFTDISESDYYYDAVLWAVENGINAGISPTQFGPDGKMARLQAAISLWRAFGSPEAPTENPFTDIEEDAIYYEAVLWVCEEGYMSHSYNTSMGYWDTTIFDPYEVCLYGHINWVPTKHTHQYTDVTTVPCCTEGGYTTYTCELCGYSYQAKYEDALGHTFVDGTCISCGEADPDYEAPVKSPFTDVPAGAYYEAPVLWAVENSITSGVTKDSFNPGGSCLRAQVVTFLWRAEGQPEPAITTSRFTDVKPTDFFFKPVLWAVEKNITSGVSATQFGSYSNCNRAAVVTFLWRAAGCPEPITTNNPFTDVNEGDFFYKPVLWAVENNITAGLTATTFGPTAECNRAQVVTFLYRAYN